MERFPTAFLLPQYIFINHFSFKTDAPTLWAVPPSPILLVFNIGIYISIAISIDICISVALSISINIVTNTSPTTVVSMGFLAFSTNPFLQFAYT